MCVCGECVFICTEELRSKSKKILFEWGFYIFVIVFYLKFKFGKKQYRFSQIFKFKINIILISQNCLLQDQRSLRDILGKRNIYIYMLYVYNT